MDFWLQTIDSTAAVVAFGVIVVGFFALVIVLAFITSLLIRYSVRRIRRWFVENVLLAKVETEHTSFRKSHALAGADKRDN